MGSSSISCSPPIVLLLVQLNREVRIMETIRIRRYSCLLSMLVALVFVGCSNPVAHIPELTPEQLAARPTQQKPYEQTYKMVPYDSISIRFPYHPEQDPKTPVSI